MSATMTVRELNPVERAAFRVARLVAYHQMPYYAAGLFALMPVAAPGLGTFAVDKHWRLYMDPDMLVGGWSVREAGGVLLHELGHLLRVHADRAAMLPQPFSHDKWNLAGDAEINDDLLDAGVELPQGVVTPQALGCNAHDCAEVYYDKLVADKQADPDNSNGGDSGAGDGSGDGHGDPGCGSGAGCGAVPGELPAAQDVDGHAGVDDATGGMIRRRIAEAVREAASSGRGTVPAGVRRWAEGVLAPAIVPWNRVLRSIVRRAIADVVGRVQFTYAKPSRRSGGVIFPAMRGPRLRVSVVVDTSGSMSEADLRAALSEIKGVLKAAGITGDRVTVLTCDAESVAAQRVSRVEDVVLTGGGGTDMRVGIEAAEKANPSGAVTIVATDGDTPWPVRPTRSRLVCVVIGNDRAAALTPSWALTVTVPTGAGT